MDPSGNRLDASYFAERVEIVTDDLDRARRSLLPCAAADVEALSRYRDWLRVRLRWAEATGQRVGA